MKTYFPTILCSCLIPFLLEQIVLPYVVNQVMVTALEVKNTNKEIISNGIASAARKADLKFEQAGIVERMYLYKSIIIKS